jgi:hypothetical protein
MSELLSSGGSIYVHVGPNVNHLMRGIADEVFGPDHFLNQIIWRRAFGHSDSRRYGIIHDVLLFYSSGDERIWNDVPGPPDKGYLETFFDQYDEVRGERYRRIGLTAPGVTKHGSSGKPWRGVDPSPQGNHGEYSIEKLEELNKQGRIHWPKNGVPRLKRYESEYTGPVLQHIWTDISKIHNQSAELAGYATQKPEALPERIVNVSSDEEHRRVVLEFFRAEALTNTPSPLIHGRKSGAYCHVDGIDSIFSRAEAKAVAEAVAQAGSRQCYVLACEFEMDLRLTAASLENELGVKLMLIQIPREIMEKNRKNPPPFLEMAVLEAEPVYRKKGKETSVDIKIARFMPSLAEVPSKTLQALKERAIKSGTDFIDFWAVDFEWQPGRPFNHHWQDYRTRKDRSLKTVSEAGYVYAKRGKHTACVKVIDTFGCDTSITVEVDV